MRSVFVQWELLERERERPLRDLAEWTTIDTIELSHVYLVWGPGDPRTDPAPLALPAGYGLGGDAVRALGDEDFERLHSLLELVREQGFAVTCNLSPLFISAAELRQLSCVDVTGASVPGIHPRQPVYGCPANPEVVRLGEAMARAFVRSWLPLDAVGLNHLEYPVWPQATLRELFTCFCEACRALAATAGVDLERVRHELLALHDRLTRGRAGDAAIPKVSVLEFMIERPDLVHWLRLRRDAVSAYTERVVAALREASAEAGRPLRVGLEFQLPALAPFVGTDYRGLAPLFDWMTPKFPDYLGGSVVPQIADELTDGTALSPAVVRERLRDLLELGEEPPGIAPIAAPSQGLLYAGTFRPDVIARQCVYVDGNVAGKPVYPYLWLYGGDLDGLRAKLAAVSESGWDGFFLWCWDSDLTTAAIRAAHGTL